MASSSDTLAWLVSRATAEFLSQQAEKLSDLLRPRNGTCPVFLLPHSVNKAGHGNNSDSKGG